MTPKQMYSELAKIAGKRCTSGEVFVKTVLLLPDELRRAQMSILALMDKLNYSRSGREFSFDPAAMERWRALSEEERAMRQRAPDIDRAVQWPQTTQLDERIASLYSTISVTPPMQGAYDRDDPSPNVTSPYSAPPTY